MKRFLKWAVCVFAAVAVTDASVAYGLSHPGLLRRVPASASLLRGIYLDGARNIIQLEPDCARYDPGLSYTLRPGEFVFSNAEFRTEYRVNRLGIRSDEADLVAPAFIVIGDSRAMGWGVAQEEMYSSLLRRETGLKTLNAAVSSYGTAREMKLLDRLDTSAMKRLVIHYVDNDYDENASFFRHANVLPIMSRENYLAAQRKYLKGKRYYFGKYTFFFLYRLGAEAQDGLVRLLKIDSQKSAAVYFLNALMHSRRTPLDGARIVVMGNGKFIERLRKEIASGDYPGYVERMVLLSDDVPTSGYFVLDNHMNGKGHRFLAERLARAVR